MSDETKEQEIVIEDVVVDSGESKYSIEGMLPEEVELAKEHGLYKEEDDKDGEHEEQSDDEGESDTGVEEEETEETEEEVNKDPDNFEEMDEVIEKDEKKFHSTYTPNQKALYFKNKANKQKRQELQKKYEELESKLKDVDTGSGSKLEKINKLLTENVDDLTIEALQAIINGEEKKVVDEPIKPEVMAEKISTKSSYAEQIGTAKYPNFIGIANLAKEVASDDKSGDYQRMIDDAFINDAVDESALVDRIVKIAKLHPKYNEVLGGDSVEKSNVADRVAKNSKKKASSASLSSSGGRRTVSESQLTCADAEKLSISQWSKLSEQTRRRIKMGIDP